MTHLRLRSPDGYDLAAVLTPAGHTDVVIWMHGISVDKDEYLGFFRDGAEWLARRDIASVRFDFRGHGQSAGTSLDFSIAGQNLDVRAVMEFVRHRFHPKARLHLVGASFGAPPAVFAAERYQRAIASVSLISPVLSYRRTFLRPETEWAQELFSTNHLQDLYESGRLYFDETFCISPRLVEEMWIVRPDVALRGLSQRVLVIHGDRDSMVPYDATFEACRELGHVRLVTLAGADHGFMHEDDEEGVTRESLANKERIFSELEAHIRWTETKSF